MSEARDALKKMSMPVNDLDKLKYRDIERINLGYKGIFYPTDWRIQVRPVRVDEIKHFCAINETNPLEVSDATDYMIENCIRIINGAGKTIKNTEIYVHDRLALLLEIRMISDISSVLSFKFNCPSDNTHQCEAFITPETIKYIDIPEKYSKYVDVGGLNINTKSFGIIKYTPTTIGINKAFTLMIQKKSSNDENIDKFFIRHMSFYCHDNDIEKAYDKYIADRNIKKISVLAKIREDVTIGHSNEVAYQCKHCGSEGFRKMRFTNGFRNIFIVPIEDDELA